MCPRSLRQLRTVVRGCAFSSRTNPCRVSNLDSGRKSLAFVESKTGPIHSILCSYFRIDLSQLTRSLSVSNVDRLMDSTVLELKTVLSPASLPGMGTHGPLVWEDTLPPWQWTLWKHEQLTGQMEPLCIGNRFHLPQIWEISSDCGVLPQGSKHLLSQGQHISPLEGNTWS